MIPSYHISLISPLRSGFALEPLPEPMEIIPSVCLVFHLVAEPYSWGETPSWYSYQCMSCLVSSGDCDNSFKTEFHSQFKMKNGPTIDQIKEMNDHARQHNIMWSWVNSIERNK